MHNFLESDRAPDIWSIACDRICGALEDSASFWNRSGLSQIMALQVAPISMWIKGGKIRSDWMRRSTIPTRSIGLIKIQR